MKILFLSQVFPYPPFDGNVLPIYHFLRCLAPRVHFTLLTTPPARVSDREAGLAKFRQWGLEVIEIEPRERSGPAQALVCLSHGRWWANRFFRPELAHRAREMLAGGGWDLVHSEGILNAQHLPSRMMTPLLLVARDCLSLGHQRRWRQTRSPAEWFRWAKIRSMEAALYRRAGRILAISPTDAEAMRTICPWGRIDLLPNGVDVNQFQPVTGCEEPGTVAFTGAMDYPPNVDAAVWFAREVWPQILRENPQSRLLLIGRDPAPEVEALSREPSITVTGRVDRIEEWLARAEVVVSPLRYGTGMKNKVLEGAAMGKAMVVSPVSIEDIELAPGRELELAEGAEAFAAKVTGLLKDSAARRRLGEAARGVVETKYTWEAMAERLWRCYQELAGGG